MRSKHQRSSLAYRCRAANVIPLAVAPLLLIMALARECGAAERDGRPFQIKITGQVRVSGGNFSGTGRFKFALLDEAGRLLWTNEDSEPPIEQAVPAVAVAIPVSNGIYAVPLGDQRFGMAAMPPEVRALHPALRLRIWFDDGEHGFEMVSDGNLFGESAEIAAGSGGQAGLGRILEELRVLRRELDSLKQSPMQARAGTVRRTPPAPVEVSYPLREGGIRIGDERAPVVFVEYSEYQCPYCGRFQLDTYPELKRDYIDTGKILFVARNLPLPFHKLAQPAAHAALCAHDQGRFEEMRTTLYENMGAFEREQLLSHAGSIGLDVTAFRACLESGIHSGAIEADKREAAAAGVKATPSFVIGRCEEGTLAGYRITGARPIASFKTIIDRLLRDHDKQGTAAGQ